MIDLWWEEAEKYQVLPLDDRTNERFYADKPAAPVERKSFTYRPGTAMIPESACPPTRNRSHAITAEIQRSGVDEEGVIIAQGGLFGGYALYIKNNRLIYDHNYLGLEHHVLMSEIVVPVGASILRFEFEKTGEHQGKGALFINGESAGELDLPRTVPVRYSLSEGLEIGRDTATPVSESYPCPFEFQGEIKKVVVEVNGQPHRDPAGDARVAMGRQ
jgi:arylsulfatase